MSDLDIQNVDNEIYESFHTVKGTMQVHKVTWCREKAELHFNTLTCLFCDIGKSCTHYNLGHIKLHIGPLEHQDIQEINKAPNTETTEGPIPDDKLLSVTDKPDPDTPEEDKDNTSTIEPNEWVAVLFNDFWYPGVILSLKRKCLEIQFMDRKGEQFF